MTGYADIDVGLYVTSLVKLELRNEAAAVLKHWPAVNATPEYARGLAAVGRESEAQTVMASLVREHPKDTLLL